MNPSKRNRLVGKLRGSAVAAALAGVAATAVAVPAPADTVTTTRTVRTYDYDYPGDYPTTIYYRSGPIYDEDVWGYAYPPAPAYAYVGPVPPPPVGATVGIPGVIGLHFGW